jgi:hypothetical protein
MKQPTNRRVKRNTKAAKRNPQVCASLGSDQTDHHHDDHHEAMASNKDPK